VLAVGDRMPDASVWLESRKQMSLRELFGGRAVLLLFYLFDWSST
jgi:peroxiredoxin